MDIRTIERHEAEDFLRLLCSVFSLDIERARTVYYSEPMFDLTRKWALFDRGEMVSICSTSPLEFGWGKGYGIAGVATIKSMRGHGFASQLLNHVHRHAISSQESAAFLFAHDPKLYRNNGFEVIDEVIRGPIVEEEKQRTMPTLEAIEVEKIYAQWAEKHPSRLRRNRNRWNLWNWNMKLAHTPGEGYICIEGQQCREAILLDQFTGSWPVSVGTEWTGLRSLTEVERVPVLHPIRTLYVMSKCAPDRPQMFLTDQF